MGITIDASLARGYRNTLYRLIETEAAVLYKRFDRLDLEQRVLANSKAANKMLREHDKIMGQSPIILHRDIYGKYFNAQWWMLYLTLAPEHDPGIGDWTERALLFSTYRVSITPNQRRSTWQTTVVGEHALTRMYQRISWVKQPQATSILPELKILGMAAVWYHLANQRIAKLHEGQALSTFIPGRHGVWFGVQNPGDEGLVEIRTYVGNHQLPPAQLEFADKLRKLQSHPHLIASHSAVMECEGRGTWNTIRLWSPIVMELMNLLLANAHLMQREPDALAPRDAKPLTEFDMGLIKFALTPLPIDAG